MARVIELPFLPGRKELSWFLPRIEIDRRDGAGWTTQTFDADDEATINGLPEQT